MRGGAFGATMRGLAGKARDFLKSSRIISTKLKAHPHGLAQAVGHAAGHFGYGRRRRYRRGGALKLAGMGRRSRLRNLPMAY